MALSVCCLTGDPGPRVAALLAPLREVADEIVVAADSRAAQDDLDAYASACDRLLRIEYEVYERHLAWLHAQCRGDWILRIDGDEVVSPALVGQLPDVVRRRDVHQCMVPRRWLYGDGEHWLDELPWWPDFQIRLVRNDGQLRFRGADHTSAEPVRPAVYLDAPLLHLEFLTSPLEDREAKVRRYDATAPDLVAPGGGVHGHRFYLPEQYAEHDPVPLPAEEAAAVAAVLSPPDGSFDPVEAPAVVSLAESDRHFGGRVLPEEACAASIEPFESRYVMAAGERRPLHFTFRNEGGDTWPWDHVAGPAVSASYHWRDQEGAVLDLPELRTAFPHAVAPGESVVVPLMVQAPSRPGRYRLEVDAVQEGVSWFGAPLEVTVEVVPTTGLAGA